VLGLVAEGMSNRLVVTERTVEAHVTQIFQKLGLPQSALVSLGASPCMDALSLSIPRPPNAVPQPSHSIRSRAVAHGPSTTRAGTR
jgi:hypothetical protein